MTDNSFDPAILRQSLFNLAGAVRDFRQALEVDPVHAIWIRDVDAQLDQEGLGAREMLLDAVMAVAYEQGQDPKHARRWIGLVPASPTTIQRAQLLNQAKESLRVALRQIRGKRPNSAFQRLMEEPMDLLAGAADVRRLLGRYGRGRLHVVQATRHLPILERAPEYVGFCWAASGKKIRVLSTEEAVQFAQRKGLPSLGELDRLRSIPEDRALRLHEALPAHLRANVRFPLQEGEDKPVTRCVFTSMPLFYPATIGTPVPDYTKPVRNKPEAGARTRKRRSDALGVAPAIGSVQQITIGPRARD